MITRPAAFHKAAAQKQPGKDSRVSLGAFGGCRKALCSNFFNCPADRGNPSFSNSSNLDYLTAFGDTLYFIADDGVSGYELWKSDGTAEGTERVIDLNPGPESGANRLF
jgi:ELWxxDGT repeat protein